MRTDTRLKYLHIEISHLTKIVITPPSRDDVHPEGVTGVTCVPPSIVPLATELRYRQRRTSFLQVNLHRQM